MSFGSGSSLRCGVSRLLLTGVVTLVLAISVAGEDKAIHLSLPKHSKPTPVQKLNREGVKAIEKHQYERARRLFYDAYLLDPDDPFTLNNLGYISELEGNVDRAARYYDLAQQQNSDATVDIASSPTIEGKPVSKVAGNAAEMGMQVNRINIAAISLLLKDRAPEADLLLQKALKLDPHNPFTLNNMGFVKEKEGELESALGYYNDAAKLNSREPVIVTVNKAWRGKPISEVASQNADKLRRQLPKLQTLRARVDRLNLQGVSAMNRNDRDAARNYFEQAYKLDPHDAFTLNNMGFLSEIDGDRETANFYYEKARDAKRHGATVTVATRVDAEGKKVSEVAQTSGEAVDEKMKAQQELRRSQGGSIELHRRPPANPQESAPDTIPKPPSE